MPVVWRRADFWSIQSRVFRRASWRVNGIKDIWIVRSYEFDSFNWFLVLVFGGLFWYMYNVFDLPAARPCTIHKILSVIIGGMTTGTVSLRLAVNKLKYWYLVTTLSSYLVPGKQPFYSPMWSHDFFVSRTDLGHLVKVWLQNCLWRNDVRSFIMIASLRSLFIFMFLCLRVDMYTEDGNDVCR